MRYCMYSWLNIILMNTTGKIVCILDKLIRSVWGDDSVLSIFANSVVNLITLLTPNFFCFNVVVELYSSDISATFSMRYFLYAFITSGSSKGSR
ncbi:hypothetical protein PFISCL1PPCAC_26812 [Pristionchus fissidentatus]|uniref:G protein-coupled receptor n=1 Tax=Pristionchus fissidentatus TaxID=1538716 RepID=A0AAV5WY07_9BILA|nr:hypothetical protein PFISCL1PPCAC_26812 [Pristionchus fissidentatus]